MARKKSLTVQRSIYLTPEIWEYLGQFARQQGREYTENTVIREAIRQYIENQSEVVGSRRHFQKSLQERVDHLEKRLVSYSDRNTNTLIFYLQIIIHLLAIGLAHLMTATSHRETTAQQLVQKAVIETRREETVLSAQIQSVRDMNLPEKP